MQGYISRLPGRAFSGKRLRGICLLGATGSIGRSTLAVVRAAPGVFRVKALAGGNNIELLAEQIQEFSPSHAAVCDEDAARRLRALLPARSRLHILFGSEGFRELAALPGVSHVLAAQSGAAGLPGTEAAVRAGKIVALANKESLVMAGALLRKLCAETGAALLPVDSEHNALFQCLHGNRLDEVERLILTASGGPFFGHGKTDLAAITPEQALNHPTWNMGARISIDSATLLNKGLEIIEACALFGLPPERVRAVVHQQSLVHSLVEYTDGSVLAHLGPPDMRLAIAHCLFYPRRAPAVVKPLDIFRLRALTFVAPDLETFPALALAREAQGMPGGGIILNAADEEAVRAFLARRIGFLDIPACLEHCLHSGLPHANFNPYSMEDILGLDEAARAAARSFIATIERT